MNYDVVIAGGGPVAGHIAGSISRKGYSVLVLEEHGSVGLPVQCAGLVTTKIKDIVDPKNCVLNTVSGARIFSPSGHKLELDSGTDKAYVIDRARFDKQLMDSAVSHGTDLELGSKAVNARRINDGVGSKLEISVSTKTGKFEVQTGLLIGADGVNSNIRSIFDFPQPKLFLRGMGLEFPDFELPREFVQIFSGNKIAPGFFAWIIPTGSGVRIGLCIMKDKGNVVDYHKNFLKQCIKNGLVPDIKAERTITGMIPLGALNTTTKDNVLIVGDAAAQVKPTSGGGLYPGLICAEQCSRTSLVALEKNDFSNNILSSYNKQWHKSIGTDLDRGLRLHRAFLHLSDDKLEEAFEILDRPEVIEVISKKGDIESPFMLAKLLFKKAPKLIKFAGPYFRSFSLK